MRGAMHVLLMATKTISIDLEAYELLRRARREPNESFSRVIKRATWDEIPCTAGNFLDRLAHLPPTTPEALDALARIQRSDLPPEDSWRGS